jgi:hypothetical protein
VELCWLFPKEYGITTWKLELYIVAVSKVLICQSYLGMSRTWKDIIGWSCLVPV